MKTNYITRIIFTSGRFMDIECDSKITLINTGSFRKLIRNGYNMGLIKSYYTIG